MAETAGNGPDKAVILARGLGTRMRKAEGGAALTPEQAAAAASGVKALMPVGAGEKAGGGAGAGRPFLDYVLSALADAGWRRVCLVIGPEHDALRRRYAGLEARRVHIEFAVQERPLGTADAVAAAEDFAAGEPFLCINSDNYYPPRALEGLRGLAGPGLAAFERDALVEGGNIPAERIRRFGLLDLGPDGCLRRIVEKPSEEELSALPTPLLVSMNCWRFDASIFAACRAIGPSPRGELEITSAVQHAIDRLGIRFQAVRLAAPVLDLTGREDVAAVAKLLAGRRVEL